MGIRANRIIIEGDNELMKETRPVIFDLFCRGTQVCSGAQLAGCAFLSIVLSPLSWPIMVVKRSVHLLIFFAAWWVVESSIAQLGVAEELILTVGLVLIFYQDIYSELTDLLVNLTIILSAGRALRWACSGYLSGTGFRQQLVNSQMMEKNIVAMVAVLPEPYKNKFDRIFNLYMESNQPEKEQQLRILIKRYWSDTGEEDSVPDALF